MYEKKRKLKIIKITEGFVTNSSSYSGYAVIAARKGKDIKSLLKKIDLGDFISRFKSLEHPDYFNIEYDDLLDDYNILEASVLLAAYGDDWANGAPEDGEDNELRWFIEENDRTEERVELVGDDLILLYSMCHY